MRIAIFCHSIISDWNNGNAHFLRGIATELHLAGHRVTVYEQRDAWSMSNLVVDHGIGAVARFRKVYPYISVVRFTPQSINLEKVLDGVDLVLVHEWNDRDLVRRIGNLRNQGGTFRLLFHDTHHRSVSSPQDMQRYDLSNYDGVLAFGAVVRDIYMRRGWARKVWVWHEAADVRVFYPRVAAADPVGDVVWIGNWGDDERTAELREFLIRPVAMLRLSAAVHGVRYPAPARDELARAGIACHGWLPNFRVPEVFARYRATVHVPRRPYATALPGIPTIRVFEALACGIPLVSAPWEDSERMFSAGSDYLLARDGRATQVLITELLNDETLAASLAANGRRTILERHTCRHRVKELLAITRQLGVRESMPLNPVLDQQLRIALK